MKYADKTKEILLDMGICQDEFFFSIMNAAANKEQDHRGTGIGVHNIEIMMEQMQGRCEEECGRSLIGSACIFHLKNQKIHKETFTFSWIFRQRCLRENRLVMKKDSKNRSHGLYSNQSTGRGFSYYEI